MAEIQRLTEEDVLQVRRRMAELSIATQDAFGKTEPLYPDKLSSAVFRQDTGTGGIYKYNTIADVGATLFYGVAMSHASKMETNAQHSFHYWSSWTRIKFS